MKQYKQFTKSKTDPSIAPSFLANYNDSLIGFSYKKILDNSSIFHGHKSLYAYLHYLNSIRGLYDYLPDKKDYLIKKIMKIGDIFLILFKDNYLEAGYSLNFKSNKIEFETSNIEIFGLINSMLSENISERFGYYKKNSQGDEFEDILRFDIENMFLYVIKTQNHDVEFYGSDGLTKDKIIDFLWKAYKNSFIITLSDFSTYGINIFDICKKDIFGSSTLFIEKLENDYNHFRNKNISRGYLLIGNPGTGKTGIINNFLSKIGGKTIILGDFEDGILSMFDKICFEFDPDFVVFDDCDRIHSDDVRVFIRMIDSIKENNPNITFLFMANKFGGILEDEAIVRAGRIDQIYEIAEPNEEDRKEIILKYLNKFNIKISEEDFSKAVLLTDGKSGAELKELCLQLERTTVDDYMAISAKIAEIKEKYGVG